MAREFTRITMNIPDSLVEYFQDLADELAIPRSSAMIVALQEYKTQRDSMGTLDVLVKKMEEIEKGLKSKDQEGK